jgi:GGDEF domain-containing protein
MTQFGFHTTGDEVVSAFADRVKNKTRKLAASTGLRYLLIMM